MFVPYHLLFPLFSSVCFVFGVMLAKQAFRRGVTPWTGTFLGNFWLAVFWGLVAAVRGQVIPTESWGIAAVIGLMFVLGQVFTYLAFQFGDVSVATPLFGLKVLMVAALSAFGTGVPVGGKVWLAGGLATMGVILIQWSGRRRTPPAADRRAPQTGGDHAAENRADEIDADDDKHSNQAQSSSTSVPPPAGGSKLLTVVLALSAAFALSLFDVSLQKWAHDYSGYDFLPVMFGAAGLLSLALLPFVLVGPQLFSLEQPIKMGLLVQVPPVPTACGAATARAHTCSHHGRHMGSRSHTQALTTRRTQTLCR